MARLGRLVEARGDRRADRQLDHVSAAPTARSSRLRRRREEQGGRLAVPRRRWPSFLCRIFLFDRRAFLPGAARRRIAAGRQTLQDERPR
jgi:hypothetical protein